MSVPTNLIPTKITGLPEYTGNSTLGYFPYVLEGRTYQVQFANLAAVGAVPSTRVVAAGTGLTGGGDLSQDRVIAIANGGVGYSQLANSGVTAGSYGSGSQIPVLTIDDKGRVTSASSVSVTISGYVPDTRRVDTDASLIGGGPLSSNLTLGVNYSASLPQALGTASAGVSTAAARGDHVHPAVNLSDATQTQGALPLGRGGTGDALSPVAGAVVYSTGTKFALADPGLPGQVLMSAGTGEPYWATVSGTGTVTSVAASGGTTGMTFSGSPITAAGTLTLGGTLNVASGGTGATTASTARTNLGAAASGANSDITSLAGITGAIASPDYIDFDTAATVTRATGRLWWDNADGNQTLSLGMAGSNATLQIGEEMYFRVKASSAITEGQVVMFTGTVGASGALTGAPATGLTKSTASYIMGVATEDIALNGWGYVTQFGLVRGINTTGGAEAWVDGQILYYDPTVPGGLTKNQPTAPAAKVEVAAVIYAASNGSLFVRPSARFELTQLNDVESSGATNLDLLQYNGTGGYWQHRSPSTISVGSATNLAGGAANRIAYQTGAGATSFITAPVTPNTFLEWSGSAFQWSSNPLGTVTSVNASGGTTGLTFSGGPITTSGTLTLGGTLGVANGGTGATSLSSGYVLKGNGTSAVSASVIYDDGTNVGIGTTAPSSFGGYTSLTVNNGTNGGLIEATTGGTRTIRMQSQASGSALIGTTTTHNLGIMSASIERITVDTSGNVGIGTNSPQQKLQVSGGRIRVSSDNVNGGDIAVDGTGLAFSTLSTTQPIIFLRNNYASESMRIDSGGSVGIGTSIPDSKLHVASEPDIARLRIGFGGTSFNYYDADNQVFRSGNATERMRIDSAGNVGIGTSSPNYKLDVAGTVNTSQSFRYGASYFGTASDYFTSRYLTNMIFNVPTGSGFVWARNGGDSMTLDSSGNLGLGVTPSASNIPTIQSSYGIFSGNSQINIAQNAYYNSGWKYTGTAAASLYFQGSGAHNWQIAPSGTAGNAISFTQAMTLNASGGLSVGTTTDPGAGNIGLAAGGKLQYSSSAYITPEDNVAGARIVTPGAFNLATGGTTARVTVDGSGNVGIGTSSPVGRLTLQGAAGTNGINQGLGLLYSNGTQFGALGLNNSTGWPQLMARAGAGLTFHVNSDLLTTGEAMRIDASGNVGVNNSSPGAKFDVYAGGVGATVGDTLNIARTYGAVDGNTAQVITTLSRASSGTGWSSSSLRLRGVIDSTDMSYIAMTLPGVGGMAFGTGFGSVTERMRIDSSGNVGIGTSTPSGALNIVDQNNTIFYLDEYSNADGAIIRARRYRGTIASPSAVQTGDALTALRGFGYTSAGSMGSLSASIDFYAAENFTSTAQGAFIAFRTNAAGGAGAATERMRIDSVGNVGIGTSSPTSKLAVYGNTGNAPTIINVTHGATGNTFDYASVSASSNLGTVGITSWATGSARAGTGWVQTVGAIPLVVGVNDTEVARFNTSGNFGIGTSTIGSKLTVNGYGLFTGSNSISTGVGVSVGYTGNGEINAYNYTAGTWEWMDYGAATHNFYINGSGPAMRIDSSGNVKVNTTVTFGKLSVYGTTGFNADANAAISGSGSFKFRGTAAGTTITTYDYLNYTAMQFIRDNGNPTNTVGSITCTDTATTYNTSSDRRLKKDIVPAGDAGVVIDAIEIVSHGWKASEGTVPFGVIAQDLHAIAPQAVHAGDDGEEVSDVWGVDYSKLVPMLVKEIQSLRARVAQLEGK